MRHRLTIMKKAVHPFDLVRITGMNELNLFCANATDKLKVTHHLYGASKPKANSPTKIKKHVRYRGTCKLVKSSRKMRDNVVQFTREFSRDNIVCWVLLLDVRILYGSIY